MFTFSIVLGKDDDFEDIMKQDVVLDNVVLENHALVQGSNTDSSNQIPSGVGVDLFKVNSNSSQNKVGQI
jgi:hypothetical protein